MYAAMINRLQAKMRFKGLVLMLCATLAPKGAIRKLAQAHRKSAGRWIKPAVTGRPGSPAMPRPDQM